MNFFRLSAIPVLALLAAGCGQSASSSPDPVGKTEQALSTSLVISQVYGAGGNSGATYTSDYVELFNAGTTAVDVAGWSVQYHSNNSTGSWLVVATLSSATTTTIAPGHYFLLQLASGSTGTALPTADLVGATVLADGGTAGAQNISGSNGTVALVKTTTALTCTTNPCVDANLVDLVGYGTGTSGAIFYEGAAPAPTPSSTLAATRKDVCVDTDQNGADFAAVAASPHNSKSPPHDCVAVDAGGTDGAVVDTGASDVLADTIVPVDTGATDSAADVAVDSGAVDSGVVDSAPVDTGVADSAPVDTGVADSAPVDTGVVVDSGTTDTGAADSAATDSGKADSAAADTGSDDTGSEDTGTVDFDTGTADDTGVVSFDTGTSSDSGSDTGHDLTDTGSSDSSGCSCDVAGKSSNKTTTLAGLASLLVLGVVARRRR